MVQTIIMADHRVTKLLQERPGWLHLPLRFITILGSPFVTVPVLVLASLINPPGIAFIIGSLCVLIDAAVKPLLRRERPDTAYAHNMKAKTYSFPSGHAFGVTLACGLLLSDVERLYLGLLVVSVAIILLVGYSRVYLGAHYMLDVVIGWLSGGGVLLLILIFS